MWDYLIAIEFKFYTATKSPALFFCGRVEVPIR